MIDCKQESVYGNFFGVFGSMERKKKDQTIEAKHSLCEATFVLAKCSVAARSEKKI